jgi:hypothetical protein
MSDTEFLILVLIMYAMCTVLAYGLNSVSRSIHRRVAKLEKRIADLELAERHRKQEHLDTVINGTLYDYSCADHCPLKKTGMLERCKSTELQEFFECRDSEVMGRLWSWQGSRL